MEQSIRHAAVLGLALGMTLIQASGAWASAQSLGAAVEEKRIAVYVDGELFTAYEFGDHHKYPFFYPVNGPATGQSVTTWDQEPYPHQSSLYLSLDWVRSEGVNRGNYWQPRHELGTGHVLSQSPHILAATGDKVVLQDTCDWTVPDAGVTQLRDTRTVTITAPGPTVRILDFEIVVEVLEDLVVGPTGHSFFSARMQPALAVGDPVRGPEQAPLGTGTIVDSDGNVDEEGTREQTALWCAYYGQHHGETEGLAIVQHPDNPMSPAPWFNRDYGFMSPTPFDFRGRIPLEKGETLRFRYRTIVFTGDHEEGEIAKWADEFLASR